LGIPAEISAHERAHRLDSLVLGLDPGAVGGRRRCPHALRAERGRGAAGDDLAWIQAEHERVQAMRSLMSGDLRWDPEPIPDVRVPAGRLRVEGTSLDAASLLSFAILLRSSRRTIAALRDDKRPAIARAVLDGFIPRLLSAQPVERAIEKAVSEDGEIRDDASSTLRRLRRELRSAEESLLGVLENAMRSLAPHQQVADMSVTIRNGRYVIPVRRDARNVIRGLVHDTSATGATLFVEPPAAIEAGNRIRGLQGEELREIDKILRELTERVRPLAAQIVSALDALVELDSLYARARFAAEFECAAAEIAAESEGFSIVAGRHPLLLAQRIDVVPFNLEMEPSERTLLLSGPNTGGKTVLLKAVGLFSAMVQSGIPAPVAAGSRVALFDDLFADIGDEQSIAASLSTFSAHVKNLAEILRGATPRSLVLIDELGSGTDPMEGAALGGAILEELTRRGTFTLATTHLGALKELATSVPGVVNASLEFDAARLAPTYRLVKGIPGRSYGLSIARRLDLPGNVLDAAEERLPKGERDTNALLTELQERDAKLAERDRETQEIAAEARERLANVAARERLVRERERELEKESRSAARKHLLDARAAVEETIRELRATSAAAVEDAARLARRNIEQLAGQEAAAIEMLASEDAGGEAQPGRPAGAPEPGDLVELGTFAGRTAKLLELREDEAVVALGSIKLNVPRESIRRAAIQLVAGEKVPLRGEIPEVHASTDVDLRGLRASEVEEVVMQAVDSAVLADLKVLRIIHGKGTGALRERVNEMLKKEPRVSGFRLGAWNEGGTGVTIAELA
ncbi:MAG: Smr/MutS family protein, partial [Gemmatimonadaceae bacterium]|nr:Smr/MutS family protein [Gemmatimonadaceae bacterium]